MIPKANSVFTFELGGFEFTIHGNHFRYRSCERSARKFKRKPTTDLWRTQEFGWKRIIRVKLPCLAWPPVQMRFARRAISSAGYLRSGACCDNGLSLTWWLQDFATCLTEQRLNISFKKSHVALNFNRVVQSHRLSFLGTQPKLRSHMRPTAYNLGTLWEATHLPSSRFSLMWEVSVNVGLGEGWVSSFPGSLDANWFHLKIILPGQLFSILNSVLSKNNQNKRSCSVFAFIWESHLIS